MSDLPQHLDLHLIRILYLLLLEKSVSRVAIKLNQPQPSISAALRKLRALTGDPILVRGARQMVPTLHGEGLLAPAKRILDETDYLFLKKSPFSPQTDARTFHIAAPDYLDSLFLPNLVAQLRRTSPNSRIKIHGLGPGADYLRMLSDGEIDVVIANWEAPPEHLHMSKLFEDPIICVMRANCPYALRTPHDQMSMDDYLTLPHVAPTQILPGYAGVIEDFLQRRGLQRNVMVESAYFGLIPEMLAQTDLVLTTGRQFVRRHEQRISLKTYTVPIDFPIMGFYQLWHERVHHAPEHKWLRDMITDVARQLKYTV